MALQTLGLCDQRVHNVLRGRIEHVSDGGDNRGAIRFLLQADGDATHEDTHACEDSGRMCERGALVEHAAASRLVALLDGGVQDVVRHGVDGALAIRHQLQHDHVHIRLLRAALGHRWPQRQAHHAHQRGVLQEKTLVRMQREREHQHRQQHNQRRDAQ